VGLIVRDDHVERRRNDPVVNAASENQTVSIETQGCDCFFDHARRNAEVDERADGHVAGDPRDRVEEEREANARTASERGDRRELAEARS
jgi:hypothetical protein